MLVNQKAISHLRELLVTVNTPQIDENSTNLRDNLDRFLNEQILIGFKSGRKKIIAFHEIISIHTQNKEVVCETEQDVYRIKQRLYEVKLLLPRQLFVQISSSEIVNFSYIQEFALAQNGIYQVILKNGKMTYTTAVICKKSKRSIYHEKSQIYNFSFPYLCTDRSDYWANFCTYILSSKQLATIYPIY